MTTLQAKKLQTPSYSISLSQDLPRRIFKLKVHLYDKFTILL